MTAPTGRSCTSWRCASSPSGSRCFRTWTSRRWRRRSGSRRTPSAPWTSCARSDLCWVSRKVPFFWIARSTPRSPRPSWASSPNSKLDTSRMPGRSAPSEGSGMARTYNVVDADGHILEPLDLWDRYIDPEFRERRPRFVIDENGKERLSVEGKLLGNPRGIGSLGSVGARQGIVKPGTLKYAEGRKGGFDPHARIVDMDADGIDAAFLYPSLGLFAGAVEDPGLAAAMCRAYNRWLADYCKPYPERLFGVAMLPMQSVELAVDEMRYAREKLGMRGGFLRPNPYHGNKMINHPMYEPFWMMAEALDFSVGFHEGSTNAMPTVGVDRFEEDRAARHMISHTMEMMLVALSVIWGGVVDRHPRLRVAFLESGGGWIAPWLDRMDRHFDDLGFNESAPKTRPSELFQRNCWISFEPVESSIAVLADYIGPHKIMWATDYPHSDGFFPGAPQMLRERLRPLSPEAKHQVLAGGALGFYGLT